MAATRAFTGEVPAAVDLEAAQNSVPPLHVPETPSLRISAVKTSKATLMHLDLDGDGKISPEEVRIAASHAKSMHNRELYLLGVILLLIAGMFGTSFFAIKVTQDMHISSGRLTDNAGRTVVTRNQLGSIEGVHYPAARRLNSTSNATDSEVGDSASSGNESVGGQEMLGVMQITAEFFQSTVASYATGQTEWVVNLPDSTVRTVHIMGASAGVAWGSCGDYLGTVMWIAQCEESASECSIDWEYQVMASSSFRRLSAADDLVELALLARSSRPASNAESDIPHEEPVERVLNTKLTA